MWQALQESMQQQVNVYPIASLAAPEQLAGGVAVVIDVLRASTTIAHALAAGAAEVIPCLEVEEARRLAGELPSGSVLLGGERRGMRIEGFDLGNSPSEYSPDRVAGKTVVFTTTNGTRAMLRCRQARRVLIGAFVNATAVLRELADQERIDLVCAGTDGQVSRDDLLLAGLVAGRLARHPGIDCRLNPEARMARQEWDAAFSPSDGNRDEPPDPELLARELRNSPGGRNLTAIGLDEDIVAAAQMGRLGCVPELDVHALRIRLPRRSRTPT
jgi:2-phosphosulfolactate phosphatase